MTQTLTHLDTQGQAHMVDVGHKAETHRIAIAEGSIALQAATLATILDYSSHKGDVLAVARIAAIQGAKRTADLIPLCHPLPLTKVSVQFTPQAQLSPPRIHCQVTAETHGRTGVEMEALTAVSVALLTIYDMCKAIDRGMSLLDIQLVSKQGGVHGDWQRETLTC